MNKNQQEASKLFSSQCHSQHLRFPVINNVASLQQGWDRSTSNKISISFKGDEWMKQDMSYIKTKQCTMQILGTLVT